MVKKIGLGKGLETLLGVPSSQPISARTLPLSQLQAGRFQPRHVFRGEELKALANSIKQHGVIQALVVRPIADKKYEIVAGERRFRAAKLAGLQNIPVEIRELSDEKAQIFAMVENLQRTDLNAMEQAKGLSSMIKTLSITHQQVGEVVGKSRAAVTNLLRLLDLHKDVQALVEEEKLEMGQARALLSLPVAKQLLAAKAVISGNMTTRTTEQYVKKLLSTNSTPPKRTNIDNDTVNLMNQLSKDLNMRVEISPRKNGSGKLAIHYGSLNSLDKLIRQLKK